MAKSSGLSQRGAKFLTGLAKALEAAFARIGCN